ncbi:MAG: carbohydrate ABC transporter permease [Chloroflexota bacterium]|nr:carbohydrate ABC transporter permease [Chloroflexota bacterium]
MAITTVRSGTARTYENLEHPRQASRRRMTRMLGERVFPRVVLIAMCLVFILPFYWMVALALKSNAELSIYPPTLYPHSWQWSNFKEATEVFPFWRFLWNTTAITFLTILGSVISCPIIAYGFSRIDWPGRDKVFMVVLASVFIPFPVLIVALFDIFAQLGWVNTWLPLIVPRFFGTAFWIFLVRQFFLQIPRDLSDAARIDGANEFQIFWSIIMPQSLPALGVVAIFSGLAAWNDFFGPLIFLQDASKYTLSIGLTFFQSQDAYDVKYNLLMAASSLVVLPVVVLFLLFQRTFVSGLNVGSIK